MTSNKRARQESPERSTGATVTLATRPGAGPSKTGPNMSKSKFDKGKGTAKAGPSMETPAQEGSQSKEANTSLYTVDINAVKYQKALKNVLETSYRWKSAPAPAPFPVDLGGESHWKKIMSNHAFNINAEKRAYVYALWGQHNLYERDAFIHALNEAMSDPMASENLSLLQHCATLLASWTTVKVDCAHENYFKVAWLVYSSWATPLLKRQL